MLIKQHEDSDLRGSPPHINTPPTFDILDNGMREFPYMPAFKLGRGVGGGWGMYLTRELPESPRISPIGSPFKPGTPEQVDMASRSVGAVHVCAFCGVKFNNPSNLEVHLQHYCSHNRVNKKTATDISPATITETPGVDTATQTCSKNRITNNTPPNASQSKVLKIDEGHLSPKPQTPPSPVSNGSFGPKRQQSPPLTGAFRCQMCSYTADKQSRLGEHMSTQHPDEQDEPVEIKHRNGVKEETTEQTDASKSKSEKVGEWHCEACDIRFNSLGNFQAHKEFYCGTRGRRRSSNSGTETSAVPKVRNVNNNNLYPSYASAMLPAMMPMAQGMFVPMMTPFGMTYAMVPIPAVNPGSQGPETLPLPVDKKTERKMKTTKRCDEQPLDLSCKKEARLPKDDETPVPNSRRTSAESEVCLPSSHSPTLCSPPASSPAKESMQPKSQPLLGMLPQPMIIPAAAADINRCEECNIVFYKHENYKVHKELYCATRRGKETTMRPELKTPPLSPRRLPLPLTPENKKLSPFSKSYSGLSPASSASSADTRDAVTPEEYAVQYLCVPCKIQFSNPDTLEAHQQYYCPTSKAIAEHAALHSASASMSSRSPGGISNNSEAITCLKCAMPFSCSDDLIRHTCTHTTMKIPMFCCPYCDYVAQSDNRLLDHIKAHAPTKAYRCELCGYRGNTVRGMRMHGKSHIDAGESFTDDHMTEYNEPPLIPKRLRTVTESVEVNVSSEVLRANVDTIQRRKRRSMATSFCNPATGNLNPDKSVENICTLCNVLFPDSGTWRTHMKVHIKDEHLMCKTSESSDGLGVADSKNSSKYNIENILDISPQSLKQGTKRSHDGQIVPKVEPDVTSDGEDQSKDFKHDPEVRSDSLSTSRPITAISPKNENLDPNSPPSPKKGKEGLLPKKERVNYCKQCDIPFVYLSTFLAHKKYYCSSHAGERNVVTPSEV